MSAVPKLIASPSRSPRRGQGSTLQPLDRSRPLPLMRQPSRSTGLSVRPSMAELRLAAPPQRAIAPTVKVFPTARPLPGSLKMLLLAQRVAAPLTFLLVGATALVYGWTVYTQQLWSHQYHQLQELHQQERQLVAADEMLKNQLAQQAFQADSGLVTSDLNSTVFLDAPPPAPTTAAPLPDEVATPPVLNQPSRPFAY